MSIRHLPRSAAAGWRRALLALAALAGLAACDEEFIDPALTTATADQVVAVSGNNQSGALGAPLPLALRVQVRDARGNPAPRQRVEFRTLLGEGIFSSPLGVTDFAGFTEVRFIPTTPGNLLVEAVQPGAGPDARALFSLAAVDSSAVRNPVTFRIAGGNGQAGPVGTILPQPLTVQVLNADGNPIPRFPVVFTATTDGTLLLTARRGDFTQVDSLGGNPSPSDSIGRQLVSFSDEQGVAGVLLRLKTRPGTNEVAATTTLGSGQNNIVVFSATGSIGGVGSADSIVKVSGDEQRVKVDTTGQGGTPSIRFNPMVVQVTDRFGNAIQGVTVLFRVSVGSGNVSPTQAVTDANGFAETVYTSNSRSFGGFAVSASALGVGTVVFTGEITPEGTSPDTGGGGGGGGGGSGSDNPVPSLSSITPTSAAAGSSNFTLTVNGSNFVTTSTVQWNGSNRPTSFVNANQMTAQIPASDVASVGVAQVRVFSPLPGGGTSAPQQFTITP